MIKMIVTDLDGTLLNNNRKVSDRSKEYLKHLKDNGYIIVIATGRIYALAMDVTDGASFANYIIADSGACIYDISGNKIFKNVIDKELIKNIFKYYNDNCDSIDICCKDKIYEYSDRINLGKRIEVTKDINYILNNCDEVHHMSIYMKSNKDIEKLEYSLTHEFPTLNSIIMQHSFSPKKWIEMFPKECSKYNSIKLLSQYLNISNDDVIAFGDGLNDIEMIKNSGYGVALNNALDEVKKESDDITEYDNDNDGVVNYLMNKIKDK